MPCGYLRHTLSRPLAQRYGDGLKFGKLPWPSVKALPLRSAFCTALTSLRLLDFDRPSFYDDGSKALECQGPLKRNRIRARARSPFGIRTKIQRLFPGECLDAWLREGRFYKPRPCHGR